MAWTTPRTWSTSEVVTASIMNTHVRDNFNETSPAKASASGGFIIATGANTVIERTPGTDNVATSESTSSSSYTDLATSGPAVTTTTGTRALIMVSCRVTSATTGTRPSMGPAVSGASTIAADEARAVQHEIVASNDFHSGSYIYIESSLTGGSNTFTAKYVSLGGGGSVTFANRRLSVIPAN